MPEKGRIMTGARMVFSLKGKPVGYATGAQVGESIRYESTRVLGRLRVAEHVALTYDATLTVSHFRIIGETVKSLGFFPASGNNDEEHLLNVLTSGDLSATLTDVKTKKVTMVAENVRVQDRNYRVDAGGIVGEDLTMVVTVIKDEFET